MLGMIDPDNPGSVVCVHEPVHPDLQECLESLEEDVPQQKRLEDLKWWQCRSDPTGIEGL